MDSVKMDLETGLARHFYFYPMANAALLFALCSDLSFAVSKITRVATYPTQNTGIGTAPIQLFIFFALPFLIEYFCFDKP
jgi:hypothetical protein